MNDLIKLDFMLIENRVQRLIINCWSVAIASGCDRKCTKNTDWHVFCIK